MFTGGEGEVSDFDEWNEQGEFEDSSLADLDVSDASARAIDESEHGVACVDDASGFVGCGLGVWRLSVEGEVSEDGCESDAGEVCFEVVTGGVVRSLPDDGGGGDFSAMGVGEDGCDLDGLVDGGTDGE